MIETNVERLLQRIVDLEEKVESLTFWSDKYSRWVAELHVVVDTIHACSGEGVTSAAEAMSDLFNRINDIEITVSKPDQPWAAHLEPIYDRARRNIRDRAFAQIEHECQTPNEEKSDASGH